VEDDDEDDQLRDGAGEGVLSGGRTVDRAAVDIGAEASIAGCAEVSG
jgi:hypothetical protein